MITHRIRKKSKCVLLSLVRTKFCIVFAKARKVFMNKIYGKQHIENNGWLNEYGIFLSSSLTTPMRLFGGCLKSKAILAFIKNFLADIDAKNMHEKQQAR